MSNNRIGVKNFWNSLRESFQSTFFKPNSRQPKKPHALSEASLKRLGFYKNNETGKLIAPSASRFSETYYESFELQPVKHPSAFPFYLTIPEEELGVFSSSTQTDTPIKPGKPSGKKHKILIEYAYSETDSLLVYNQLTDLDKQILLFIAIFRNVQFQQIVRETGVSANRVEKSLLRLLKFYLIRQYKFKRDPLIVGEDKAELAGDCYSIYAYGTTVLLVNNILAPELAHKWKEITKEEDSYSPIRYWKIADAYLNFRVKDDFVSFKPYSYMEGFTYTEEISVPIRNQSGDKSGLSEQSKRIVGEIKNQKSTGTKPAARTYQRQRRVPRIRFNGQFNMRGKNGQNVLIDLYPFVTQNEDYSDLSKLVNVFLHYGQLKNGLDKNGNQRLLMVIVDSTEQIQAIENKYHLSNDYMSLNNILFLDLEIASQTNVMEAMKVLLLSEDRKSHKLRTAKFNIDDTLLNRSEPKTKETKEAVVEVEEETE
jgi:hypothetical protein